MKINKSIRTLGIAVLSLLYTTSSLAGVKEGGGWGNFESLYSCTEKNPTNPSDPKLAFVTKFRSGIQLIVRQASQVPPNDRTPYAYNDTVLLNESIQCYVECQIFENQKDSISFGVTKLDERYEGIFESPTGRLNFSCEVGEQ